jgi:undecaprenyl diphosphate synthase
MSAANGVPKTALPAHIGIIMDGNGRWATRRNLPRTNGHLEGLKAAKRVVKAAAELGVRHLTLYAFSTENWKRTREEVGFLMGLIAKYLLGELDFYRENRIRVRHCGDLEGLPPEVVSGLRKVIDATAQYDGLTVTLAINYGGRDEIVRAVRKAIAGCVPATEMTEKTIAAYLDNPDIPDPDLIIRSASEQRMSNFLLWESAYSEFYFSDTLWPDWDKGDLSKALEQYAKRNRRFGGITE